MKKWFRRIRAALVIGATWGLAWGLVGGFLMEAFIDPRGQILDMWPQALAIPGFFAGALFSLVLFASGRRRRFEELSLRQFGALGAVTGLALGVLLVGTLSALGSGLPPLWIAAVVVGATTVLSSVSASGSLALARLGKERVLIEPGPNGEDNHPIEGKGKKLSSR